MFVDPAEFAFTAVMECNWPDIREEYQALSIDDFVPWPENDLYDFGWRVYPLIALGQLCEPNLARCPRTARAIAQIPGVVNVGISLLAGGARIHPHTGYESAVIRFHLGVDVPPGCCLKVGDEVRAREDGKVLAFDDTVEHSAWNDSVCHRAVLLWDVPRPGTTYEITASARKSIDELLAGSRTAENR